MKRWFVLGAMMLVTAAAVQLSPLRGGNASAATVEVEVDDNYFQNETNHTTTVNVGDTVHWTWEGQNNHSVTAVSGATFDSGIHGNGFTFDQTFNTAGTIQYQCSVHGTAMTGTIVVESAQATGTPAASTSTAGAAASTPQPAGTPATGGGTPTVAPTLPSTGTGGGSGFAVDEWLSLALALAGITLMAGALAAKGVRRS